MELTRTQQLKGYHRRQDGSIHGSLLENSPKSYICQVCERPAWALWGFEKEGSPDLFICETCVLELELARGNNGQSAID